MKKPPQSMPYDQGKWSSAFSPRARGEKRYWLVKSEPDVFSFDDLLAADKRTTTWDGVRNTGARNFLRDGMKKGDGVLYYHSNAMPSAVVGLCTVTREGYPDESAFDPASEYFDEESDRSAPMWYAVDIRADRKLARPVTLADVKANPALSEMALIRVSRLSVVPVTPAEWEQVCRMGG
jgi:predicted RNA-binding protein with PUA-like domain